MLVDFGGCWLIEVVCKHLFANNAPKSMIVRGSERRERRRAEQAVVEKREAEERARREAAEKAEQVDEKPAAEKQGQAAKRIANGQRKS